MNNIPKRGQPWHVKLFLSRSTGWPEKERRRAATLLGMCDQSTGGACALLLLQDRSWLDHLKPVQDQITFTLQLSAAMAALWEAGGLAMAGSAANLAEWMPIFHATQDQEEARFVLEAVAASKEWSPEDRGRLRQLLAHAGLEGDVKKFMFSFMLERRDCLLGFVACEDRGLGMTAPVAKAYCAWAVREGLAHPEDAERFLEQIDHPRA